MRLASLFLYEILPWIRDDRGEPEKVTVVSIKALGAKTSTHFSDKCRIFFITWLNDHTVRIKRNNDKLRKLLE